jgi:phospholipid/cholesterol/gamma-HCH transport system substrate-binding protein
MKRFDLELTVGLFMIAGIACLGYLTIQLGRMEVLGGAHYELEAVFSNGGGVKTGSSVIIAGVEVGQVKRIALKDYQAQVTLSLNPEVKIQEDAIAAVKTKGLIGEKYVEISPGGSDRVLAAGERIRETQPAVDLEQLISGYIFGKL